jgi:hypothetical protein
MHDEDEDDGLDNRLASVLKCETQKNKLGNNKQDYFAVCQLHHQEENHKYDHNHD